MCGVRTAGLVLVALRTGVFRRLCHLRLLEVASRLGALEALAAGRPDGAGTADVSSDAGRRGLARHVAFGKCQRNKARKQLQWRRRQLRRRRSCGGSSLSKRGRRGAAPPSLLVHRRSACEEVDESVSTCKSVRTELDSLCCLHTAEKCSRLCECLRQVAEVRKRSAFKGNGLRENPCRSDISIFANAENPFNCKAYTQGSGFTGLVGPRTILGVAIDEEPTTLRRAGAAARFQIPKRRTRPRSSCVFNRNIY